MQIELAADECSW